jgi:hypothetical protein
MECSEPYSAFEIESTQETTIYKRYKNGWFEEIVHTIFSIHIDL